MDNSFNQHGTSDVHERNETDPRRWVRNRSNRDRHSMTLVIGRGWTPSELLLRFGAALRRAFG